MTKQLAKEIFEILTYPKAKKNTYGDILAFCFPIGKSAFTSIPDITHTAADLYTLMEEANKLPALLSWAGDEEYRKYLRDQFNYTTYIVCTDEHWGGEALFCKTFNNMVTVKLSSQGKYPRDYLSWQWAEKEGIEFPGF